MNDFKSDNQRLQRLTRAAAKADMSIDRLAAIELAYRSYFRGIECPHTVTAAERDIATRYIFLL